MKPRELIFFIHKIRFSNSSMSKRGNYILCKYIKPEQTHLIDGHGLGARQRCHPVLTTAHLERKKARSFNEKSLNTVTFHREVTVRHPRWWTHELNVMLISGQCRYFTDLHSIWSHGNIWQPRSPDLKFSRWSLTTPVLLGLGGTRCSDITWRGHWLQTEWNFIFPVCLCLFQQVLMMSTSSRMLRWRTERARKGDTSQI